MSANPWDIRPKSAQGDADSSAIFFSVGRATHYWEMLESSLSELFDCLVSGAPSAMQSNRAAHIAYAAAGSSLNKNDILRAVADFVLRGANLLDDALGLIDEVRNFAPRRNEIAHGMVASLGEYGHFLIPNNTTLKKWHMKGQLEGHARYQYVSADIEHYIACFKGLELRCDALIVAIQSDR
jgi:hypothetical protein